MSKGLDAFKEIVDYAIGGFANNESKYQKDLEIVEKELKALELIKKHILDRDMDTSGFYLEYHNGFYEPYYTIEIKEGTKQVVYKEEYELLKEVLL